MNKVLALLVPTFCVCLLAGCEDGTVDPEEFGSYDALSNEYERIAGVQTGAAFADPAALPVTGTAVYEGVINIIVLGGASPTDTLFSAVGGLELETDFERNGGEVSGFADNFYRADGVRIAGGGSFSAANIDRAAVPTVGQTFTLDMFDGFRLGDTVLDGTLSGDFVDQAAPDAIPDSANGVVGGVVVEGPGTGFRGTWVAQYDPTDSF